MLKVFLSPLAERKLELLLEEIEFNWSKNSRDKFLVKITKSFNQVAKYPKSCKESNDFPNLFKCIVTNQTSFFYRIKLDEIEIITLVDNRQDTDKTKEELKHWH
jgi:plasmid stabilization system protein ParE